VIVPDTSVWIDFSKGVKAPYIDILLDGIRTRSVVTTDVIITEFLQGFRHDRDLAAAERLMRDMLYRSFWGRRHARRVAENYRILRRNGITPRNTIDVIIGTFCIENGFSLLHNDPTDYEPMEKYLALRIAE